MKASLGTLLIFFAHLASCADISPPDTKLEGQKPKEKKVFGLNVDEFYAPFMFRIKVECPDILMQSTDSQSVDLKVISPQEKIKAVIQFFFHDDGTLIYHFEERHVGDCKKPGFEKMTSAEYEGHYCYGVEAPVNGHGAFTIAEDGGLAIPNIGHGRPDFHNNQRYIVFTYDSDFRTPGLKGKTTYLVPIDKPLTVEDKSSVCK